MQGIEKEVNDIDRQRRYRNLSPKQIQDLELALSFYKIKLMNLYNENYSVMDTDRAILTELNRLMDNLVIDANRKLDVTVMLRMHYYGDLSRPTVALKKVKDNVTLRKFHELKTTNPQLLQPLAQHWDRVPTLCCPAAQELALSYVHDPSQHDVPTLMRKIRQLEMVDNAGRFCAVM